MNTSALVCVDVQNDYFPGGRHPLADAVSAGKKITALLGVFRQRRLPIIHIRQISPANTIPYLVEHTPGSEIHECAQPRPGEMLLHKRFPNSFRGTGLKALLNGMGIERIYLLGFMSQVCIDATARQALDNLFRVSLIPDACAAGSVTFNSQTIEADWVHAGMMGALGSIGCELIDSQNLLDNPEKIDANA